MNQIINLPTPSQPIEQGTQAKHKNMQTHTMSLSGRDMYPSWADDQVIALTPQQPAEIDLTQVTADNTGFLWQDFDLEFLQSLEPTVVFPEWNSDLNQWNDEFVVQNVDGMLDGELLPLDQGIFIDPPQNDSQVLNSELIIETPGVRPLDLPLQPVTFLASSPVAPGQLNQTTSTIANTQLQHPAQMTLAISTRTSTSSIKNECLNANGANKKTNTALRGLRRQFRPDTYYISKPSAIRSAPGSLEHFDYLSKGAIEQPADGENIKLDKESCLTCIRYGRACKGNSVVRGKCENCSGMHKQRTRTCLWLKPEQNIWSYPDAQNEDRVASAKKKHAGGLTNNTDKKTRGVEHKRFPIQRRKIVGDLEDAELEDGTNPDYERSSKDQNSPAKRRRNVRQHDSEVPQEEQGQPTRLVPPIMSLFLSNSTNW